MDAGTHLTAESGNRRRKWMFVAGGTLAAVVVGGLMMQSWRAPTGEAAVEPGRGAAPAGSQGEIVARVERDAITYDLLAQECVNRYGAEVLEDLISRLIIQQACAKAGQTVTEGEVNAEIARVAQRFGLDTQGWYQMLQSERKISPQQYRDSVIWPMLALRKIAGEQVDITEEEMERAFVRNYGPRVKARVIMLDNPRRAQEVWEKVSRTPDEFEKFAQQYSIDPGSRSLGGQVPPIPRFSGSDNLEAAAFKLKAGEISGIVQIENGRYVILKCEGRTEQIVQSIEDVKDGLYDELKEQKTQQLVATVFDKVKSQARVDNYLTKESTGPERAAPPTRDGKVEPAGAVRLGNGGVTNAGGTAPTRR